MFTKFLPVFGKTPGKELVEHYSGFHNYENGKFVFRKTGTVTVSPSVTENAATTKATRRPATPLPVPTLKDQTIKDDYLIWYGHSTFLLQVEGKKVLIDPMFGPIASPFSFVGPKRYSENTLKIIDELPFIDALLITHDHYDHLDYPSIQKIKNKVGHFFVPYGVSHHLNRWGVAKHRMTELNWWDEAEFEGLTFVLTPSKHFSGRGISNRNSTLWGGWAIIGRESRYFTSGDGGYDGHFKEIGEKYGPFDLALIEGGQYDRRWSGVHMFPEQSVQASLDVGGKHMMLIHWAAFTLANHSWTDPIVRAVEEAKRKRVHLITPAIGEMVPLNELSSATFTHWWEER